MAQAYGLDLLGTIAKPVTAPQLQALMDNYVPPQPRAGRAPRGPSFTFAEIGIGLQARQFEPYFQPKIELATGQVKGLETFARWRHPEHGVLGPTAFIDALEQNNRIDFLDWTMIEKSVERCREFQDKGTADPDLDQPGAGDAGASGLHAADHRLRASATACCPTTSPSRCPNRRC